MTELRAGQDELKRLLALVDGIEDLPSRIGRISEDLVGRPYLVEPLVGSPTQDEQLVSRVDGFDCVTLAESVVALATSPAAERFEASLIALRYHLGRVTWIDRNHYMSLWIDRNEAAGAFTRVLPGRWVAEDAPRTLSVLAGYPPIERTLAYLPLRRVGELDRGARTGDVVCFVSTRDDLDTYHVGILVARAGAGSPRVRHASRSAGRVVEESLEDFLQRNETPGLLVARPRRPGGGDRP